MAALLARKFGKATVTFNAVPDRRAATLLGLNESPSIINVGIDGDVIFRGLWNLVRVLRW